MNRVKKNVCCRQAAGTTAFTTRLAFVTVTTRPTGGLSTLQMSGTLGPLAIATP